MGDGRVRVEIVKEGSEIIVKADRDGFRYLAGICESLATSAEPDSVQWNFVSSRILSVEGNPQMELLQRRLDLRDASQ